ncbi:hypothetical protein [Stygiolobus caldivivus]|uniref:Uncharacterized protein n=1 Tax=Stygiolobus caldivivus TaxID=2824673 RepID=A0A8D5ZJA1_9CREN|nr:hypothetical protein [Stygiolobus caldivivus]BCU71384.1 hypothetical protein KN1_26810 [Stygiolobus caldivivus]
MSAKKFQKIESNAQSILLAKLAGLIYKAEEIHEEIGEEPTTDLEKLYTESGAEGSQKGKGKLSYLVLYDEFTKNYISFISSVMRSYASRTKETEIEFINILLNDGNYIVLEGEEDKVVIPHPSAISSTHTHPNICIFSHKDLETASYLFVKNYLLVGVTTDECALLIYRRGVFTIEDQKELEKLAKVTKKSKTLEEVLGGYKNSRFNQLALRLVRFV